MALSLFLLKFKVLKPLLIIRKSQLLINLIKHLSDLKARRIVSRVNFNQPFIQGQSFINFTLNVFKFCQQSQSLVGVLVLRVVENYSQAFVNCVKVAI